MTRSPAGVGADREPAKGWSFSFASLGATLIKVSVSAAIYAAGVASGAGLAGAAAWVISQALLSWALWNSPMSVITTDVIMGDRREEGLNADRYYVALCGPSGSGKSSILNALRGLLNRNPDAARTGTTETTLEKQEYEAAACFDRLSLVDFPGAGTQRVPSREYFKTNKLHCYDFILILCGERFGEIEIALVQACIVQGKRFAIVRSRSDEAIRRVEDDKGISLEEAKTFYIQTEVDAIAEELERASLPRENIPELLGFFILVNKNTLRRLTVVPPYDWPTALGSDEIHERKFLQFLGKTGATEEYVNPSLGANE